MTIENEKPASKKRFFETSSCTNVMYPRYHSNCVRWDAPSGSSKPYALTRQSREASTCLFPGVRTSSSEGMGHWGVPPPGFHRYPALCGQRAPSVFVIAFLIHLRVFYRILPWLSRGKLRKSTRFRAPNQNWRIPDAESAAAAASAAHPSGGPAVRLVSLRIGQILPGM